MNFYPLFKFFAFKADPEHIHELSLNFFSKTPSAANWFPHANIGSKYRLTDGHIHWDFPIGLAAGLDKNAQAIDFFSRLGFGAVEVGTVTPKPQEGNPRPRIWRLPQIKSLRNAMGFPNAGAEEIKKNIIKSNYSTCLGVNLGKNKTTSVKDTPQEYANLYNEFHSIADYLVINISSPNTPGLRDLQTKEAFKDICIAVDEVRKLHPKPLYLKIAPDLNKDDILDLIELAKEFNFSGIIATNTTIQHQHGKGGLSGHYIKDLSRSIRQIACEATRETGLSVIGVGGVDSFQELLEFWKQGGAFMQIYTSFVYQGPKILHTFQKDIDEHLASTGFDNLQSWVNSLKN